MSCSDANARESDRSRPPITANSIPAIFSPSTPSTPSTPSSPCSPTSPTSPTSSSPVLSSPFALRSLLLSPLLSIRSPLPSPLFSLLSPPVLSHPRVECLGGFVYQSKAVFRRRNVTTCAEASGAGNTAAIASSSTGSVACFLHRFHTELHLKQGGEMRVSRRV